MILKPSFELSLKCPRGSNLEDPAENEDLLLTLSQRCFLFLTRCGAVKNVETEGPGQNAFTLNTHNS